MCVCIIALLSILNNKTANVEMGRQLEATERDKSMLEEAVVKLQQDKNKRVNAQKEEEGKKYLEELQTQLAIKTAQV